MTTTTPGNGNGRSRGPAGATVKDPANPGRTPPRDADATRWIHARTANGTWGRDETRTYQLLTGDRGGSPQWGLMLDGIVRFGTDRTAAPDPDFPDRADEADPDGKATREGLTDFTVRMERGGRVREKVIRRMPTSQARDMAMLDVAGTTAWLGAAASRTGRQRLFEASLALSEAEGRDYDVYHAVTGHHVLPDGERVFIGGTRAVRADGSSARIEVSVDSRLQAWTFPDPLSAAEMTAGLQETAVLLDCAEPRVAVPKLATAWRPFFGVYRDPADPAAEDEVSPSCWDTGVTGAGKSGMAAAAVNCAGAPGIRYNSLPFKAGPSKYGGISGPGLERILFIARDLCIPFDDLDPAVPAAEGRAWQSDFLRKLADQKSRAVAEGRDGLRDAKPPRCLSIASGEPMDGEDSGINRTLNIPFDRDTVNFAALRSATTAARRMTRARFGTALLCEILKDYDGARAALAAARETRRGLFLDGRQETGPVLRGAAICAEMMATLDVMMQLAVRRGADPDTAAKFTARCEQAMTDAWQRHLEVIGQSGRSRSFLNLVEDALAAGGGHLDNADSPGQPPAGDAALAAGWRPGNGAFPSLVPQGPLLGWRTSDGSWWLIPSAATAAAKMLAERSGEGWSGTPATIGQTLKGDGLLLSAEAGRPNGAAVRLPRKLRDLGLGKRAWHVAPPGDETDTDAPVMPQDTGPAEPAAEPGAPAGDDPWAAERAAMDAYRQAELTPAATAASEISQPLADLDSPAGPEIGHAVADLGGPRQEWLNTAWRRNLGYFQTKQQRDALDRITRLLDQNPDPADKDALVSLTDQLEFSNELEGRGQDWGGPFLPSLRHRSAKLHPWKKDGLPLAAEMAVVIEGYGFDRPGYRGPYTVADRNGAWIGSIGNAKIALGPLDHGGEMSLRDARELAGYAKIRVPGWHEPDMPCPVGHAEQGKEIWVTTELLSLLYYLHEQDRWPYEDVIETVASRDVTRMDAWGRLAREQRRYALETCGYGSSAYQATKDAVSKAVSLMAGTLAEDTTMPRRVWTKGKCHRPDWRHQVITNSAVHMWRVLDRCRMMAGGDPALMPVGIRAKDELLIPDAAFEMFTTRNYPGGTRPPVRIDQTGIELGTFKIKGRETR